jgi:hypothetical protein
MKDEMKVHDKVFEFVAEAKSDRHWIMMIGGALVVAFAWFYTTQYIPDQKHIQDTLLHVTESIK